MTAHRDAQQLERLTFFSDAVFAIAMTLLVVEVRLPHLHEASNVAVGQALIDLLPNYIGFVVSFLVLARFWVVHHTIMGLMRGANQKIVWANMMLLMSIAFMPFPTAVVSEFAQVKVAICFYAFWLLLIGLLNRRLVRLIARSSLLAEDVDGAAMDVFSTRSLIPILIAAAALIGGLIAPMAGLAALVVGSPIVTFLVTRYAKRRPAAA